MERQLKQQAVLPPPQEKERAKTQKMPAPPMQVSSECCYTRWSAQATELKQQV